MKKKTIALLSTSVLGVLLSLSTLFAGDSNGQGFNELMVCPDYMVGAGSSGCKATAACFYSGIPVGSVECWGTRRCISGFMWVKCDGNKSECQTHFEMPDKKKGAKK